MPITETTAPRRTRTKISWETRDESNPRLCYLSVFDIERDLDEGWARIAAWWSPLNESPTWPHPEMGIGAHSHVSWIARYPGLGLGVLRGELKSDYPIVYIDDARPELEIFFEAFAREMESTGEMLAAMGRIDFERVFSICESLIMERDGGSSAERSAETKPARRI